MENPYYVYCCENYSLRNGSGDTTVWCDINPLSNVNNIYKIYTPIDSNQLKEYPILANFVL